VNKNRVSSPAYGECLRLPPYVDFREPGRRLPAVRHAYTARDGIEVNEYQFAPAPPDPRAADLPPGEPSHPVGAGASTHQRGSGTVPRRAHNPEKPVRLRPALPLTERVLGWILAPFVALLIAIVEEE
jgi:hypothetical protein